MTRAMKTLATAVLCVLAGTAAAQQAPEQHDTSKPAQTQAQPTQVMAKRMSTSATVEKINAKDRELTVKDAKGAKFKVTVPAEVQGFDAIKKGDKVSLDYFSSVALSLTKSDAEPSAKSVSMAVRTPGELPGGMVAQKVDETARIEKVDEANSTVTLKLPNGETDTIIVTDSELKGELGKLKKGDKIHATYAEAIAVSVERAKDKG